jgi:hypothetical protein
MNYEIRQNEEAKEKKNYCRLKFKKMKFFAQNRGANKQNQHNDLEMKKIRTTPVPIVLSSLPSPSPLSSDQS